MVCSGNTLVFTVCAYLTSVNQALGTIPFSYLTQISSSNASCIRSPTGCPVRLKRPEGQGR